MEGGVQLKSNRQVPLKAGSGKEGQVPHAIQDALRAKRHMPEGQWWSAIQGRVPMRASSIGGRSA